jgi:hypothetical protein
MDKRDGEITRAAATMARNNARACQLAQAPSTGHTSSGNRTTTHHTHRATRRRHQQKAPRDRSNTVKHPSMESSSKARERTHCVQADVRQSQPNTRRQHPQARRPVAVVPHAPSRPPTQAARAAISKMNHHNKHRHQNNTRRQRSIVFVVLVVSRESLPTSRRANPVTCPDRRAHDNTLHVLASQHDSTAERSRNTTPASAPANCQTRTITCPTPHSHNNNYYKCSATHASTNHLAPTRTPPTRGSAQPVKHPRRNQSSEARNAQAASRGRPPKPPNTRTRVAAVAVVVPRAQSSPDPSRQSSNQQS